MSSAGKHARELISFYLDAGVDAVVGEEPIDRFADVAQSPALSLGSRLAAEAGAKRREGADGGSPAMRKGPSSLPRKGGASSMTALPGAGIAAAPSSPEVAVMASEGPR